MDKVDAIISLRPNSEWTMTGGVINWLDSNTTCPTDSEIQAEITRLQADYDAKEYQRDRAQKYPSIGNQLDMLWHAIDNGTLDKTSDFYTTLKTVKDNNPKP